MPKLNELESPKHPPLGVALRVRKKQTWSGSRESGAVLAPETDHIDTTVGGTRRQRLHGRSGGQSINEWRNACPQWSGGENSGLGHLTGKRTLRCGDSGSGGGRCSKRTPGHGKGRIRDDRMRQGVVGNAVRQGFVLA